MGELGNHVGCDAVDLVVRLERRRDHPVDGEHEHEAERDTERVPRAPPHEPRPCAAPRAGGNRHRGHVTSPIRTIRRTYTTRERGDDQQHQDRDRSATPEVGVRVALDVDVDAHQVVRRVDVRGADQQVRLREDPEVPDDRQARQDEQDRLEHRERDVAEDPQRAGAVDLGRLDELAWDLGEAGVDRHRHEGDGAPDDHGRDHRKLRERRAVPVVLEVVADADLGENVVEDAVLEVRHPVPDLDGDDGGIDQTSTSPDVSRMRTGVESRSEEQRDQRPDHHRQADVRCGEDDRPDERVPEDVVRQDGAVVLEADPFAVALDQLAGARTAGRRARRACKADSRGSRRSRRRPARRGGTEPSRARPRPGRAAVDAPREGATRRRPPRRRRRAGRDQVSPLIHAPHDPAQPFSTEAMLSLADCAACLTREAAGEDLGEHVAEDVAVLDVHPVLRRRDEPAPLRRPLVDAVAEEATSCWGCCRSRGATSSTACDV